jgi:hypothetical protein
MAAPEPSLARMRVRSYETFGSIGARLSREARYEAARHVAARSPPQQGGVVQSHETHGGTTTLLSRKAGPEP